MNFRTIALAFAASLFSAVAAEAAMVTASTPVTFAFDTSGLGSSFTIPYGYYSCGASCPSGASGPEALAAGANIGFDFGSTLGGDDIATRQFTNTFGGPITNVSGGIFGSSGGSVVVSSALSVLYVTLFFVDDEFGVDEFHLNFNGGGYHQGSLVTSEVPLPAALPFFLAGLAGLGLSRRKRKQAA